MATWVRFEHAGREQFGQVIGEEIAVHKGALFAAPQATGARLPLAAVRLLTPYTPAKFLGLWNNFHQRAAREGLSRPPHPLYFVKTSNSYLASGETIRQPASYDGPVVFEGELGIVIGKPCRQVGPEEAEHHIFGYSCVNDVTARGILKSDPSFVQWVRAKGFDTFGVFGPGIVTDIEPDDLIVRTLVDGIEKQNYPVADMFVRPREIVSLLSRDMTLHPGDLIACGTSIGTEPMPRGCTVEVAIDSPSGVLSVLCNRFE